METIRLTMKDLERGTPHATTVERIANNLKELAHRVRNEKADGMMKVFFSSPNRKEICVLSRKVMNAIRSACHQVEDITDALLALHGVSIKDMVWHEYITIDITPADLTADPSTDPPTPQPTPGP